MRKLYVLLTACLAAYHGHSQISLSASNGSYNENFNGMQATGTAVYPAGWTAIRYAGTGTLNQTLTPAITDGSANTGNVYSTGTTNASDRAFGTLASGGTVPAFGASFVNNTGSVISNFSMNAFCEQWRTGSNAVVETVVFEYSTNASSLSTGTWTAVTGLNLNEILTANNGNTAVDGNLEANRAAINGTLSAVNLPAGGTLWIRWRDADVTGSDGLYAVDDLTMSWTNVAVANTVSVAANGNAAEPSTNSSFTVSLNNPAPAGGVTVTYTLSGSATAGVDYNNPENGSVTILQGSSSALVNINVIDDNIVETTESVIITLGSATNGYSIAAGTSSLSILDNEATTILLASFSSCSGTLSDGFTQQSVAGIQGWSCTTFGRSGSGVEMNGFANNTNNANEDWLVSPTLNLSATTYPILSFYSRTKFSGDGLRLFVTTTYTGDVTTTAWTELNGFFPATGSDAWTFSNNIDLSAFKQANVRFAFKYTSSNTASSRWTLDDIAVVNSTIAPNPVFNTSLKLLDFREGTANTTSDAKTFSFTFANAPSNVTVTAPSGFELSKDGNTFSSSISYTPAEAGGINTVSARFRPASPDVSYYGYLQFAATGSSQQAVFVKGNTVASTTTLNVVNWNIEWFYGAQGPSDNDLQKANAKTVLEYLAPDIAAVAEIVDTAQFGNLVRSLAGGYNYVIADYATSAVNPADPSFANNYSTGQKMALIYKTSIVTNVSSRGLLRTTNTTSDAYISWASGRFPFLVSLTATKNGQSAPMNFIVLHSKAGDTESDYTRRRRGVQIMKDTLDANFADARVVILGDFNDDLDQSIYAPSGNPVVSSYTDLISDSTDANSYYAATLPLSYAGLSSTATNPKVIDHVVVTNELKNVYVPYTATLYNDIEALTGIANYANTTSDHYPILTRYRFAAGSPMPVRLTSFTAAKQGSAVKLEWTTSQEVNTNEFVVERSFDGLRFEKLTIVPAKGNSNEPVAYQALDLHPAAGNNYYRLRTMNFDGKSELSKVVKINFGRSFTVSLSPNPASQTVVVSLANNRERVNLQLLDASGKLVRSAVLVNAVNPVSLAGLGKGIYLIKLIGATESYTEKLVIE